MLWHGGQCRRRGIGGTRKRPEAAEEEREISTVEDLEITAPMKGPNLVVAILKEGGGRDVGLRERVCLLMV